MPQSPAVHQQKAELPDILITAELDRRQPRSPAHAAENQALVALAREMANHPRNLLQKLVDIALELCGAGSAGISLLKPGSDRFFWEAMAGVYAPHVGGTTPRDFSPCGTTLDRGAPQLFFYPGRYFTYFNEVEPPIVEGLIIPFYAQGRPLGTIWVVTHDEGRRFDAEDVRIMTSLGEFTSAALHVVSTLDAATAAHQALQQADHRKDEFLATLAHELRNPLAPIRNALHVQRLARSDGQVKARALEIVDRQVNHLVRLVDDLLEVSRITRGKLELRKERTELSSAIRSAVETSRPLIEAAGHELTVTLPAEPLVVDGDPVRLAQIVANLLNNAAKYTDRGGRIAVTVERDGQEAVINVRDSGIGIAEEMLPRVFEMFTQADCSVRRSHGGLGIGLALVRNLVQMHGGRVDAQSGGLGSGSTFRVRLPLPAVAGLPAGQADEGKEGLPAAPASVPPSRRILVVDDNQDSAETMGVLLQFLGSDVYVTTDGRAALDAMGTYRPTAVLLDIGMPGMDGYEVARAIRARPELSGTTLVAVTGWGQEEDRRRTREAGFNHHLTKPVDIDALRALLTTL